MNPAQTKTQAIVLHRINYGEADRIVQFLTPDGQFSAIAKSARRSHSKLAGGIEMFCLSEITANLGKGELGILTSARPLRFYRRILADLEHLEFASFMLKKVSRFQNIKTPVFFQISKQFLESLDNGLDNVLLQIWFALNFEKAKGEEINLYFDIAGNPLSPAKHYEWNPFDRGFAENPTGKISAEHLKFLRLLSTNSPNVSAKVKNFSALLPPLLGVVKTLGQNM